MNKKTSVIAGLIVIAASSLAGCGSGMTRQVLQVEEGYSVEVERYKASPKSETHNEYWDKYNTGEFSVNHFAFHSKLLLQHKNDLVLAPGKISDAPVSHGINPVTAVEIGQAIGFLPGRNFLSGAGAAASILLDLTQPDSPKEKFRKRNYENYKQLMSPHIRLTRIDPLSNGQNSDEALDAMMASSFKEVRAILRSLPFSCPTRREVVSIGLSRSYTSGSTCKINGDEHVQVVTSTVVRPDIRGETLLLDEFGPHILTKISIHLPDFATVPKAVAAAKSAMTENWYLIYPKEYSQTARMLVVEKEGIAKEYSLPLPAEMTKKK